MTGITPLYLTTGTFIYNTSVGRVYDDYTRVNNTLSRCAGYSSYAGTVLESKYNLTVTGAVVTIMLHLPYTVYHNTQSPQGSNFNGNVPVFRRLSYSVHNRLYARGVEVIAQLSAA